MVLCLKIICKDLSSIIEKVSSMHCSHSVVPDILTLEHSSPRTSVILEFQFISTHLSKMYFFSSDFDDFIAFVREKKYVNEVN